MVEYMEFEGKTVEKALESAGKALELAPTSLEYDVVSYGSTGIFGLVGVKKAKIRVKTLDVNTGRSLHNEARQQARDLVKDAFQIEDDDKIEAAIDEGDENGDEEQAPAPETLDQTMNDGRAALQKIVDFMTAGARVHAEYRSGRIIFNIDGGNSSLLIGKRGQTLEALQYLIEKIINKRSEQHLRVLVDVQGYLETRKANIQNLAARMAAKVQKINKPVTIGQMNAYDRRIVHMHLKDNQEVRTQSVGEGYYRKLVIFPKKSKRNRKMN